MIGVKDHIEWLGYRVNDKVTGFSGVVTSVSFDLFGCIQAAVTPVVDKKTGKIGEGHWFDVNRLEKVSKTPVMKIPNFEYGKQAEGDQGCADKPPLG